MVSYQAVVLAIGSLVVRSNSCFHQPVTTLGALFADLFGDISSLRRFLRGHLEGLTVGSGEELVSSLAEHQSLQDYAEEAAEKLRQRGWIEPALWASLRQARPGRSEDIRRLESSLRPRDAQRVRGQLYVHIVRAGAEGHWTWWSGFGGRIRSQRAPLPALDPTATLLLGPGEHWQEVLSAACGRSVRHPAAAAVRVQLHVTDRDLLAVPWTALRHGEDALVAQCGWSVELVPADIPSLRKQLDVPCAIDIIATEEVAALLASMVHILAQAWPPWWDRRVFVRSPAEVRSQPAPIRLVVGEPPVNLPPVDLEATLTRDPEWIPGAPSVAHAVHHGANEDAYPALLAWIGDVLGQGKDPAEAWQRHAGPIFTAYATFTTNVRYRRPKIENARRRLDRMAARSFADAHLRTLVEDPGRRVLALFGSGTPDNLVERLFDQVDDWAQRGSPYHLDPALPMKLPGDRPLTGDALEEELRIAQGIQPGISIGTWLGEKRSRSTSLGRVVVFNFCLDAETAAVGESELRVLLEWARDWLLNQVPSAVRVLIWLATPIRKSQGNLHPATQILLGDEKLHVSGLDFHALDPLTPVSHHHIVDFLKEQDSSSCPTDLVWKVATAIMEATQGRFDEVVVLLEACERSGWFETLERARKVGWAAIREGEHV
jgi:hypothetical protein